ncbi:hypothetical protein BJ166DRAFT_506927 [Pestalotiopsis sp. NC0098]|nr:hypothetical protein BJ166DRAFT_506927 [Pestalotiopsis sp. NC0098]
MLKLDIYLISFPCLAGATLVICYCQSLHYGSTNSQDIKVKEYVFCQCVGRSICILFLLLRSNR